jgi:hypothetical protein
MLLRQMSGEIDSWAIRWNWSVFCNDGLVSYPPVSLVKNTGFDGSGTHCSTSEYHDRSITVQSPELALSDCIELSERDLSLLRGALMEMSGPLAVRISKFVLSAFRRTKLRWFNIFAD